MQYVNQRLQIQLELLMMSGIPLETCWAFNERWNNKFCYKVASCWFFYWIIIRCTDPWILNLKIIMQYLYCVPNKERYKNLFSQIQICQDFSASQPNFYFGCRSWNQNSIIKVWIMLEEWEFWAWPYHMVHGFYLPHNKKGKGKAIPLQARTGPDGSRRLRLPDFKTVGTWRW